MNPTKFPFIWQSGFREKLFLELNQSEKKIACDGHFFCMHQAEISNLYKGPSIDDSYQVSVQLAKRFQRRRFFLDFDQSETRIAVSVWSISKKIFFSWPNEAKLGRSHLWKVIYKYC
jgi:hypothetical protein